MCDNWRQCANSVSASPCHTLRNARRCVGTPRGKIAFFVVVTHVHTLHTSSSSSHSGLKVYDRTRASLPSHTTCAIVSWSSFSTITVSRRQRASRAPPSSFLPLPARAIRRLYPSASLPPVNFIPVCSRPHSPFSATNLALF